MHSLLSLPNTISQSGSPGRSQSKGMWPKHKGKIIEVYEYVNNKHNSCLHFFGNGTVIFNVLKNRGLERAGDGVQRWSACLLG